MLQLLIYSIFINLYYQKNILFWNIKLKMCVIIQKSNNVKKIIMKNILELQIFFKNVD